MRKRSIKRKILALVLIVSIASITAFCVAAFGGLFSIRKQMQRSSTRLGDFAVRNSNRFLEREVVDKLMTKVADRSKIINERLTFIEKDVIYFAEYVSEIYKNADKRPPMPIPYSSSNNYGKLTMQLKSAGGKSDYSRIKREAELLGNVTAAYVSNSSDMHMTTVSIYLGTESGFHIAYDPFSDDATQKFDPRVRPWYIGAKNRNSAFWTDPYIDLASKKLIVTCSHPFYNADGKLMGVTGIDVVAEDLSNEIVNIDMGEHSYVVVVDAHGTLLSSRDIPKNGYSADEKRSAYIDGSPEYNRVIDKMASGRTGFERVRAKIDGSSGEIFMAYAPIPITDWNVAIIYPAAEIMELVTENSYAIDKMTRETLDYVNSMIKIGLIVFILMFVSASIIIIYFAGKLSNKITGPIITLEKYLGRIAGGDLDAKIELKTGDEIERLGDSVNGMALKLKEYIDNIQKITAEKERIGVELNVATKIQASMLPYTFPPFPQRKEFDIYASMLPAKEVGGDFYDFFFVDSDTLAVVMADVSGKGVPAALFMVIAKTLIKNTAQSGVSPSEVFNVVNNMLCENNDAGMFVTAFMGYLNVKTGKFTFVNAGHTPPILCINDNCNFIKMKAGFVLAALDGMRYTQDEIIMTKGSELFFYTDGVTETVNDKKEMFGGMRLIKAIKKVATSSPQNVTVSIKREIDEFADGADQADDITMMALRYLGEANTNNAEFDSHEETKNIMEEITVAAKIENLSTVQNFIDGKLESANCPVKLKNQIVVAAEEIFVNIANYAYSPQTGETIIRALANGEIIVIEFEDGGKPYNPLEKEDPDVAASAENREVGGLGIYMVKSIMDVMDYRRERERNILTMRKKLI